ncbi:hypothetical protein [Aureimonas sp. Leaf324]|uniref:hypothetical protein n=1 Tax=Aureimonas sp. Leaf324 TaxID=1736336 RepID=UPI0012E0DC49|nr:hypothetical protein [Aureimonas sp. Leaf324]
MDDAEVRFDVGGNILAGASDTGKSFVLHCLDYILGSDIMRKRVPEAEPYSTLFVEFGNGTGEALTLRRDLSGGNLEVYDLPIERASGSNRTIAPRRRGTSQSDDVTSVIFPFAGIPEARLRTNSQGKVQRLTVRNLFPIFVVDEISVIAEQSPVLGETGFGDTMRKRMFSFLLTGKDDSGVVAEEKREIVKARLAAKLGVIEELMAPLEKRLEGVRRDESLDSVEKLEAAMETTRMRLQTMELEREELQSERSTAAESLDHANSQIIAIDELRVRYGLLQQRYDSDLKRLDFVAEGAQYFDQLQEVTCPLCDQPMTADHRHVAEERSSGIYDAAKSEAAKILAQRTDLQAAISDLEGRRAVHVATVDECATRLEEIEGRLRSDLAPRLKGDVDRLDALSERRLRLEATRNDLDQFDNLVQLRQEIEDAARDGRPRAKEWEPLPSAALLAFCRQVEATLKEWGWPSEEPRVEFDQQTYDIVVDGQARQSHGKGVRALLYSAFVVGLLRYCAQNKRPHPGFVIIDSPLTSYKRGRDVEASDSLDPGLEDGFWSSIPKTSRDLQIIVVENKEPPVAVQDATHYEWFAGPNGADGDRKGFVPPAR